MKEKLIFQNSKGDNLVGILSNPSDKNKDIVILCHGFSSSKDSRRGTYAELEKKFNEKGIATFRFDFFGHGESEGEFEDITVSEGVDDILRAIQFIKNKGFSRIALVGSSFGGLTSAIAASKSEDLSALGLRAPAFDIVEVESLRKSKEQIEKWKERGYEDYLKSNGSKLRLNYSYYSDAKKNNAYKSAENIKIPTLIVQGDADKTVPLSQSIKASKIIKGCKLEIIKGADHFFSIEKDNKRCLALIVEFVSSYF